MGMKDLGKDFNQTKKPSNVFQKFLLKILFYVQMRRATWK